MEWIKKEIEVGKPIHDGKTTYLDTLIYLLKVVNQLDPKYEYIIGLAYYAQRGKLSEAQLKLTRDLYEYYFGEENKNGI